MKGIRIVGVLAGLGLAMSIVGQASAFHCYVADKPSGAGAVTEADIKAAGNSGNLVAPGAFFTFSEEAPDVFIRGPEERDPTIQGVGELPPQPHNNGSEEHGVNALSFD